MPAPVCPAGPPVIFGIDVASMLLGGLAAGMVLFIVSVGLSVTMGLMGFVNLAHGAFAMLGGYVIVLAMRHWGIGFVPALAVGFVVTAAVSVVFERLLYARLYRAARARPGAVHHRPRLHLHRVGDAARRSGEPAADPAGRAAGPAQSRLRRVSHLQHLPDRRRHRDRARALARLRAHALWRADPRRGRQPPHGGVARHQHRPAVHHHLRASAAAWRRSAAGSAPSSSASIRNTRSSIWCSS